MRILAIDPGTSCGFAIGTEKGVDLSGVWNLRPYRGESPGIRYLRLRSQLNVLWAAYPDLRLVVYEMAHHRGGAATEYAIGTATLIQLWCAEHHLDHAQVHSAAVKKFATGRGNADKRDMRIAGRGRFNLQTNTDDEVDACWILAYALACYGEGAAPAVGARRVTDAARAIDRRSK